MKDHYRTLQLSRYATPDQIKLAYKRLALKYHPDRNPGSMAAEEKFKEVNEAYQVVGNPEKKVRYDMLYDYQNFKQEPKLSFSEQRYQPYHYQRPRKPAYRYSQYTFDKNYFKHQALAILFVFFVSFIVIAGLKINDFLEYREKEQVRLTNQKVLSSAHVKFNMGDFYGALQMIQGLVESNPSSFTFEVEKDSMINELYQKARRQYVMQDYQNAIFNFLTIREFQKPQSLETLEYLGRCYMATEDFTKAASLYEYMYLRDRYNLDLVLRIAKLYHYKINDSSKSLEYYDRAKNLFKERQRQLYGNAFELVMDPQNTPDMYFDIFYNRAKFNMEYGDFETAATDCNWASFLRPETGQVYHMRAMCYLAMGNQKRACDDYKTALGKGYLAGQKISGCD